jgi:hypothetical protein
MKMHGCSPFEDALVKDLENIFQKENENTTDQTQGWKNKTTGITNLKPNIETKWFHEKRLATSIKKCSSCKIGILHTLVAIFDKRGPPAWHHSGSQKSVACKN